MTDLFDRFALRGVSLRNRIGVSPMCQYSATEGVVGDWHLVNLGSRAVGGAGLVIAEATAVSPQARITQGCAGLWTDEQAAAWSRIARFLSAQGAVPGIQLAHAGRKASANRPWEGDDHLDPSDPNAWSPVGPSPVAFGAHLPVVPRELSLDEIAAIPQQFADAARRALDAGFQWLELHYAHGYLVSSFLSPLANRRTDRYGGAFDNRVRLAVEILARVRSVWPERYPLSVRLGVDDFVEGGLTLEEGIEAVRRLKAAGMDLVDVSIGFNGPDVSRVPWGPGFMAPVAARVRREAQVPVATSWMIDDATHAQQMLKEESVDLVLLGRAELMDPYWPYHAAQKLSRPQPQDVLPIQYAAWLRREKVVDKND